MAKNDEVLVKLGGVDAAKLEGFLAGAPSQGMTVDRKTPTEGTVIHVGRGITLGYTYDAEAQALTLTQIDKPWRIPWAFVRGAISEAAQKAGMTVVA